MMIEESGEDVQLYPEHHAEVHSSDHQHHASDQVITIAINCFTALHQILPRD